MDRIQRFNETMKYVEEHLDGIVDIEEVARIALCSEYHFKRMFSFLAGVSFSEYIRKRRLTQAAMELRDRDVKVIDIAVKYGYQSPDAFARAFQQFHGAAPSTVKMESLSLKSFPPMTFQLTIKGGNEMNYRIVEQPAFWIVGLKKRVPIVFEGVNPDIAAMWNSLDESTLNKLKAQSDMEPHGLISASTNFSERRMEEKGELDHYIGVAATSHKLNGMDQLEVPASIWAVFEAQGPFPETLQNVWGRIYSEWFPSSSYQQKEGPEILWNEGKDTSSDSFTSEIWIPVTKKTP